MIGWIVDNDFLGNVSSVGLLPRREDGWGKGGEK